MYLLMSSSSGNEFRDGLDLAGAPEPNPLTPREFGAWRATLRVHATVFRALDQALLAGHGFGVDAYGVLITLVSAPDATLPIGELGARRNLTPSGVSRSVDRLAKIDLVERRTNPDDGRSLLVGLTPQGLARLRAAQVTHHAVVRELLLDRLSDRDLERLGQLWVKAMPGSVSSPVWPL
jgi:DNA-binding MarR family transcriptional regulator